MTILEKALYQGKTFTLQIETRNGVSNSEYTIADVFKALKKSNSPVRNALAMRYTELEKFKGGKFSQVTLTIDQQNEMNLIDYILTLDDDRVKTEQEQVKQLHEKSRMSELYREVQESEQRKQLEELARTDPEAFKAKYL